MIYNMILGTEQPLRFIWHSSYKTQKNEATEDCIHGYR